MCMKSTRKASGLLTIVSLWISICCVSVQASDKRNWGPEQATGAPDSVGPGDIVTAWASLTQDDADEWLQLHYTQSVIPTQLRVYETFNPGAVVKISAVNDNGQEFVLWQGVDPLLNKATHGVAEFALKTEIKTKQIKIYLASKSVPGWNEIDAVELVAKGGQRQFASVATASSTFAEQVIESIEPEKDEYPDEHTLYSDEFAPFLDESVSVILDDATSLTGKLINSGPAFIVIEEGKSHATVLLNKNNIRRVTVLDKK